MRKYVVPTVALATFLVGTSVSLADTGNVALEIAKLDTHKWFAIAAALLLAFSVAVGTIAQSIAARAGLEGTARNPNAASKIFTPMLIAMSLIEALVVLALVISSMIISKIN